MIKHNLFLICELPIIFQSFDVEAESRRDGVYVFAVESLEYGRFATIIKAPWIIAKKQKKLNQRNSYA